MEAFKKTFIIVGIASLLSALFLLGGGMLSAPLSEPSLVKSTKNFGEMLWSIRALDILVQGVIIFVGAVGVFTLMSNLFTRDGAAIETASHGHGHAPEVKR